MISAVYAIVILTTSTIAHRQLQLKVRYSPAFCLGRHSSRPSEPCDDTIRSFWNDRPFNFANGIVRSVLSNGNTSRQLVHILTANTHNDTVFSNFYDGKVLSSFYSHLETSPGGISSPRSRRKQSFCLLIAYDGRYFCGWQRQPQNVKLPSVQEVIESAIEQAFVENGRPDIRVSGRTDSGVHALGQVARVRILSRRVIDGSTTVITTNDVFNVLKGAALTSNNTWRCLSVVTVSDKFHPTFDSKSRSYVYVLDAKAVFALIISILLIDIKSNPEATQHRVLDTLKKLLNAQLNCLVGKELDYYSLSYGKVKTDSTLCCLDHANVVIGRAVHSEVADQEMFIFEFTGNRFLRRMVRMIVGTSMNHALLRLANMKSIDFDPNQLPNDDLTLVELCDARERTRSVKVAPPDGLIFLGANMTIQCTLGT